MYVRFWVIPKAKSQIGRVCSEPGGMDSAAPVTNINISRALYMHVASPPTSRGERNANNNMMFIPGV